MSDPSPMQSGEARRPQAGIGRGRPAGPDPTDGGAGADALRREAQGLEAQ